MRNTPQDVHKKVLGKKGEQLVEAKLKTQGCKVLERNFRTPFGEADLIVADGEEIVFVEVKTRSGESYGAPREAVGKDKQRRYYKIAQFYGLKLGKEPNARFDVAEVFADGTMEYYKNAF